MLRPGAPALFSFHVGEETVHVEDFLERPVDLDVHFFSMGTVTAALAGSGLLAEMRLERSPYVPHEYPSTRGYVLAPRPP